VSSPWLGFHGDYSPTIPASPSLRLFVPNGSLIGCQSIQVYHHHPSFSISGGKTTYSGRCSYISGSYSVFSLFFRFREGRPLHNVLTFIFQILIEGSTLHYTISSTTSFPKILPDVLSLSRSSCSFKSWSLIPLFHSGFARHLFPDIHPLQIPCTTLSLPGP
jgi:hypothetical protein